MSGKNLVLQLWPKLPSTNQIALPFDYEYLLKELIDTLDLLHGDNHQGKVGAKTTTFIWVWPVVPFVQSDCRIYWSSISLERMKWCLSFFFDEVSHQAKVVNENTTFG